MCCSSHRVTQIMSLFSLEAKTSLEHSDNEISSLLFKANSVEEVYVYIAEQIKISNHYGLISEIVKWLKFKNIILSSNHFSDKLKWFNAVPCYEVYALDLLDKFVEREGFEYKEDFSSLTANDIREVMDESHSNFFYNGNKYGIIYECWWKHPSCELSLKQIDLIDLTPKISSTL
jgi:hypothetical protein